MELFRRIGIVDRVRALGYPPENPMDVFLCKRLSDPPLAVLKYPSVAERRKAETRAQGAMLLDRLAKSGPDAIQHTFELPAWRLGNLGLVAVPGELFAALGARIVSSVPGPALVLGYANGYVGYLVDDAAHAAGTYEALASPFAPGVGEAVAQVASVSLVRVMESASGHPTQS